MRAWAALATGAVVYAVALVWEATQLPPEGVPLHVDSSGTVNRVGSRLEALTISIVPGVVILALGIGLVLLARYGPVRAMNIPHKSYWLAEERQPEVRRMLSADMALAMGTTLVFLSLIPVLIVALADGATPSPLLVLLPIAAYVAAVVAWAVWLVRYRYRPQPEP